MLKPVFIFAFLALCVSCVFPVNAANVKVSTEKGTTFVILSGEISLGDTDKLKSLIKKSNEKGQIVYGIMLNSRGGNLLEGLRLAGAIQFAKIVSMVPDGSTCASACFLAFAAGAEKLAGYKAAIGVHGASDSSGRETTASGAATIEIARVVKELGVPAAIIGRMVVTPPGQMVWLSRNDLRSMGTSMVGKPSQTEMATIPNQVAPVQDQLTAGGNSTDATVSFDRFCPAGIIAMESMRETFAMIIGMALVAQKECDLPGETKRAKAYVDSFGSGFNGMTNPNDAKLLICGAAAAKAGLRRDGRQSWCTEYMAQKNLIRAY